MQSFDFKNVGKPLDDKSKVNTRPLGIRTPWREGNITGYFDMHFNLIDQLKDNFKNLILTNKGERVMRPDLGGNLQAVVFDNLGSDSLTQKIAENIFDTARKYMPFIGLEKLNVDQTTYRDRNSVIVKIFFNIPGLTDEQQEIALSIQV